MDATANGDNDNKGGSEGRVNLEGTSESPLGGYEDNSMSSFGAMAQFHFPAALNDPQGTITTNLRTTNCHNPMIGGSDGSSILLPISNSDEGANSQANAQTSARLPNKKRTLEDTEDNKIARSNLCFDSNNCADTGMLSLNADTSANEKPVSKGSKNNSDKESPNAAGISSTEQDVLASNEGIQFYSVNDVLCGRGGGTNVHPGNRRFRDLVNANRRAYLKAKKNDKPTISRSIVSAIRQMNGRFLKKDDTNDMWFEIGDDSAREKTSQALRQRAPEMRKILQEDEQRQQQQQQQQAEQQLMIHRQLLAMARGGIGGNYSQMNALGMGRSFNPSSMMSNSLMGQGQGGSVTNLDLSQSLLANYSNILQQKNWLAQQEQNMIFQRLSMAGINTHGVNVPSQTHPDSSIAAQAMLRQGFNPVVTRGA